MLSTKKLLYKITERINAIGTVRAGSVVTSSVPNATKTNVASVSVEAGTWLVIYNAAISVSSGKQYQATIFVNNSDVAAEQNFSGRLVRLNLSAVVQLTGATTIYGTAFHDQGTTVSMNTNVLRAIRLA